MKRILLFLITLTLLLLPVLAAAQAPAAPQAAPAPQQPQAAPPCQMGPGGTCIMPGATPEQMKQMQGKMGQCCLMQEGQGCPRHQQVQKQ